MAGTKRIPPTENLVAEVLASDGGLPVPKGWQERNRLEQLVRSVNRFNKAPPHTRMVIEGDWGDRRVVLEDTSSWTDVELEPIAIPARLARAGPIAKALRDNKALFPIVGAARARAVRIVHALCAEAQRRGYKTVLNEPTQSYTRQTRNDHFQIIVNQFPVGVRILQQDDRSEHIPTVKELAEHENSYWKPRIPKYDYTVNRHGFDAASFLVKDDGFYAQAVSERPT